MRLARILSTLIPAATIALLMLGGFVHAMGASLACPDWPLCYGQVFPAMQGGVLWEHSHRLLASLVGLATVVLAAICTRQRQSVGLAWTGVALVVGQGVLGGLTVIFRLPPAVSIAHLATSMVYFAWTLVMRARLAESPVPAAAAAAPGPPPPEAGVRAAMVVVFAQIVLGALVRHTHASMACGAEVLTCDGSWLPADPRQRLQTLHRLTAIVAGVVVVAGTLPAMAWARRQGLPAVRRLGALAHAMVIGQWGMGAWVVLSHVHAHVTTLHLGLGAGLWGALVAMATALRARRAADGGPPGVLLTGAAAGGVGDLRGAC